MLHKLYPNAEVAITAEQLHAIVAQVADGIIVTDSFGIIHFINPAAATLLGRLAADLLGAEFGYPIIPNEHAEIEILDGGGSLRYGEMRAVPIIWEHAPAYLIALHDSTDLRLVQQTLRDAEAFNRAVLNALVHHIAVLDQQGVIIAVNDAWRAFARQNGASAIEQTGVGVNYFDICLAAHGAAAADAQLVVQGLRAVLSGAQPAFELEYPCHSPDEERWFLMRAVPLQSGRRAGLVVAHTNITAQRRTARAIAESDALRERLKALEHELSQIERIIRPAAAGISMAPLYERDPDAFQQAAHQYRALLDAALLRRAYGGYEDAPITTRTLALQLGARWANPRDVIAVHLSGFRASTSAAPTARVQAIMDEARMVVLELMGHLVAYYRGLMLSIGDEASGSSIP